MRGELLAVIAGACILWLLSGCGDDAQFTDRSASRDLVARLLPDVAPLVDVEDISTDDGREVFELQTVGGRLVVRGSSGVAVASGLNHYLKTVGNGHLSWGGERRDLGSALRPVEGTVRKLAAHDNRYIYNFTVAGYTSPYWDWAQWEREIDLLAAHGFNRALISVGMEKVMIETFERFGYSTQELRDWIVLPAHQPWQWLGNIEGEGTRLSAGLVEARAKLGRRITDRLHELGITPVVPGYYGLLPPGFVGRNGEHYDVKEQGLWLDTFARPDLLSPDDGQPFATVATAYYEALRGVFGEVTHFAADPFHEGGSADGIDVGRATVNIQQAMLDAHPEAVWVLQAWLNNPRDDVLRNLEPAHALVLDLWGDEFPAYARITDESGTAFRGVPWVWSMLQNFGGNTGLGGNLEVVAAQYGAGGVFVDAARGKLAGLGLLMEGTGHNPIVLDLLGEMIWRDPGEGPIRLEPWVQEYADRRYGRGIEATRRAWLGFLRTAYGTTPGLHQGTIESILCARPALDVRNASAFGPGPPFYDARALERALADLLDARSHLRGVDPYEYDLVDVTRQVLANRARSLLDDLRGAFEAADPARFALLSESFLTLIRDQDRLVRSRKEFLLGAWLREARRWGASAAEQDALERNARVILSTWSQRDSLLHDYAHREWAGLLRDLYHARWQAYFVFLAAVLAGEAAAAPDFFALESAWVDATGTNGSHYAVLPSGDPVTLSEEMYRKYVASEDSGFPPARLSEKVVSAPIRHSGESRNPCLARPPGSRLSPG